MHMLSRVIDVLRWLWAISPYPPYIGSQCDPLAFWTVNLYLETHKGRMEQIWIKNSFHETCSKWLGSTHKWYILSDYRADFVKGKFKPSEDALFKDGKETRFRCLIRSCWNSYIVVADEFCWRNVLATSLWCWWPIYYNERIPTREEKSTTYWFWHQNL